LGTATKQKTFPKVNNAIKYLEENPQIAQEVQQQVRQKLEMGAVVSANSVTAASDDEQRI